MQYYVIIGKSLITILRIINILPIFFCTKKQISYSYNIKKTSRLFEFHNCFTLIADYRAHS